MIIPVHLGKESYDIILEKGALTRLAEEIDLQRKVCIVTDDGIPQDFVKMLMSQCQNPILAVVAQGETSKSIRQFEKLLQLLVDHQFTRTDAVIALGGGVVGDLAGFVAASYMRGIDFYNIPTSLLAQLDSSVGGKTAIDFSGVKNIVGAFYQPKKVIIDPNVLKTLSLRQRNAGLVEAIKMAATGNKDLFYLIKNEDLDDHIVQIIADSLAYKIHIIENDVHEKNLRKVLNFGHTVGHAIESQTDFLHGECVGMGMLYFASDQVKQEIRSVLEKFNLPAKAQVDKDKIFQAILHDKKTAGNYITIVQVDTIGSFNLIDMPLASLKERLS